MIQILYRSSCYGWVQIAVTYSACPSGIGDPDCEPAFMRAYTHWECFPGVMYYNYRLVTLHNLEVGDTVYSANTANRTGDWNESGKIKCTNN